MTDVFTQIGNNIRHIRKSNGISIPDAAWAADIDPSYFAGIERGKHNITVSTLASIASAINVEPSELLLDNDKIKEKYQSLDIVSHK
ncbi:MAG: helix-turn-helix transcriptional regulator [Oscillospiraceae bacterium]|nr:helix-turn-helix transcriptional regulator [Oscillospiraceae bacterium]